MASRESKRREEEQAKLRSLANWERDAIQRVYDQAAVTTFKFTEGLMLRHTLILGASGSGKTNHAYHIINEALPPDVCCLIIDVKKEYRKLKNIVDRDVRVLAVGDEPRVRFNPLGHPHEVPTDLWDWAFSEVFTRSYNLAEPSRRILMDSLATLRRNSKQPPTLRHLEQEVTDYRPGSSKEQNSQTSLVGRLHLINGGPVEGLSLRTEEQLDLKSFDRRITIFELGRVDSQVDQMFLTEIMLMQLWQYDKSLAKEDDETDKLKRLIVVEEAHRYLSEDRPPTQKGKRTLLEFAVAEARRYGWGFLIIDQMPLLLSDYVWSNSGTILVHRLSELGSYKKVMEALGGDPTPGVSENARYPIALRLPENLALFRRYAEPGDTGLVVGSTIVPRVGGKGDTHV